MRTAALSKVKYPRLCLLRPCGRNKEMFMKIHQIR